MFRRKVWYRYEKDAARHWEGVWADHWRGETLDTLIAKAAQSQEYEPIAATLEPNGRVLEAGCGFGQWLRVLRDRCRIIVGLDRFPGPMTFTKGRFGDAEFVQGDVAALTIRPSSFDAELTFGVIPHYEARFQHLLAEVQRVLADDGVLWVSVPYYNLVRRVTEPIVLARSRVRESRLLRRLLGKRPLPPKRFYQYGYTNSTFRTLLAKSGFVVEETLFLQTDWGLLRDYPSMRALRRRAPAVFRVVHRSLTVVSPRFSAHMQLCRAVKILS